MEGTKQLAAHLHSRSDYMGLGIEIIGFIVLLEAMVELRYPLHCSVWTPVTWRANVPNRSWDTSTVKYLLAASYSPLPGPCVMGPNSSKKINS